MYESEWEHLVNDCQRCGREKQDGYCHSCGKPPEVKKKNVKTVHYAPGHIPGFWETQKRVFFGPLFRFIGVCWWLVIGIVCIAIVIGLGCGLIAAIASLGVPVLLAILILVCL